MAENSLMPGAGGLAAPAPSDEQANPLQAAPQPATADPGPSDMMQHYGSMQDTAAARFQKVKEAKGQITATREELDKLLAMGDTVTTDDVVKASGGLVAAGIPAVEVAGILAQMPTQGKEALQAWVQQQDMGARQKEQQVTEALALSKYQLGLTAIRHIAAESAEAHHKRSRAVPGTRSIQ